MKEGLFSNYGFAGPEFVNYLMHMGVETILTRWREWREIINQQTFKVDHFSARLSEKLAVITLASELAEEALGLTLNVSSILEMLLQMIDDSNEDRNLAEKAYDHFMASYTRNHRNFNTSNSEESGFELWGKYEQKTHGLNEIYVLPDAFKKIMAEGEFEDVKVILKQWRDKDWIDCEEKKYTKKRAIRQGYYQHVHIIRIKVDENVTEGQERIVRRNRKISTPRNQMNNTFEE